MLPYASMFLCVLHCAIQGQVLLVVCSVVVALNCHSHQSKRDGLPAQALHLVSRRQGMALAAINTQRTPGHSGHSA